MQKKNISSYCLCGVTQMSGRYSIAIPFKFYFWLLSALWHSHEIRFQMGNLNLSYFYFSVLVKLSFFCEITAFLMLILFFVPPPFLGTWILAAKKCNTDRLQSCNLCFWAYLTYISNMYFFINVCFDILALNLWICCRIGSVVNKAPYDGTCCVYEQCTFRWKIVQKCSHTSILCCLYSV